MFRVQNLARVPKGRRVAAILVVFASAAVLLASPAAAEPGKPRLLILPVVVHSAEAPEYVRGGLADMLNSRFARIGALEVIRDDDPEHATSQLEEALAAGRAADADFVLFGSFTRFGKGASLDVQCAPTAEDENSRREPLREIFVHSGSIGEIIPDLDELAGKVSRFARGEAVQAATPPAAPAAASPSSAELDDLLSRVAALEASLAELLESDVGEDF
jgi:TolB-like protein